MNLEPILQAVQNRPQTILQNAPTSHNTRAHGYHPPWFGIFQKKTTHASIGPRHQQAWNARFKWTLVLGPSHYFPKHTRRLAGRSAQKRARTRLTLCNLGRQTIIKKSKRTQN